MASGERRLGTSRRGMTVLGKIPMPSVPKPINLPSQRSENRGLEPNVEIVPRGTFSWGNAGNNNVANFTRAAGVSGITSSPPTSSGARNGGFTNPISGNDVVSLAAESSQLSSSGNGTRPLSAPTIARSSAWGSSAKTQAHVQVQSSGFTVVPLELATPKLQESLPQLNEVLGKRPTSSDGSVGALELHCHSGAGAYAGAGSGQIPCSKGLQDPGDDHYTFARQGMSPASSELCAGAAPHPGAPPHEACFRSFGMPHYGSPHNRDMVIVRMVNNPGAYEGYQSHLIPVECFGQSGVYGNYRPQIRNIEQFPTSGHHAAAAGSGNADIKVGNFPSGNKFLSQEREGLCNSGQDLHKYKDGQFGTLPRDWGYFGLHKEVATYCDMTSIPTQRNERNHTMPGTLRRRNPLKEAGHLVKQEVPEMKITLLTKTPRVEAQKTENSISNATLVPDCPEGSETCAQERKKAEGSEVKGSINEVTNLSVAKQDISGDKEELLGVETGKNKVWSAGINTPFPTLTSAASNENVKNEDSKVHSKWDGKADADFHRGKSARQARKVAMQGGLEPVGADGQPACGIPTKQIIGDDVAYRDGQRLKIKAPTHISEKAWRPKSPIIDSILAANAFSAQAAGREKINEKHFGKATDRGEPPQGRNTGDTIAFNASISLQNKKTRKRRNIHSSDSGSSGISSKVEAHSFSVASNECAINELTICEVERGTLKDTSSSHACNTGGLVSQGLSAEALSSMEIEGLSQKKAKGRPSCQKAEKEWRPKSPALEVISSTDSIYQSQAYEALPVSDGVMKSNYESKILEQEGLQALGTYDYEGQRERLKIAAQRAKQLRQEEEERAREQRAKALAKLEELDRRKLANSTSLDVLADEAPPWKAKKRPTSSKRPSTDILLPDFEKQHIDEAASVRESPARPMVDNKEVAMNEETVSHNSRNKRDGNSSTITEDRQVCEHLSGTSSSQGQMRMSRRDPSMGQIGLPSDQDMEADLLSNKKHEVKKDKVAKLGRPRRQKGGMHNQVGLVALNNANERNIGHLVEEPRELKLQLTEPIAASDVDFLSEKVDRLHMSWRQKISHGHSFLFNSDRTKSDVKNEMHSALEESIDAPTQARKPRKIKNGGKLSSYVQQRQLQFEGCVTEDRFAIVSGSAVPELTEPNATFDHKRETGVNSIEQGKDGGSRWRQKNGRTGSHASKLNSRNLAHLEATDEAHEGILDPTIPCAPSSSQTSFSHIPRNNMKHSPKAASGASQWHKVKSSWSAASFQQQESGYHVASEKNAAQHPGTGSD